LHLKFKIQEKKMKKNIVALLLVVVVALGGLTLTGCKSSSDNNTLTIYTTFYPIYDLTQKVVGDRAEIINLVGPGEDAHHYELTPKQVAALETEADLIIINGLDMEHFVEELSQTVLQKVFVASDGLSTIQITTEASTTKTDPHVWLSIKNAKQMMQNIKNHMSSIDAQNASYYENNYQKYAILFDALDASYETTLSAYSNSTIVVSHQAFGYLANDYGLTQLAISGLETDGEANPQTVAEVIDYITSNQIAVVYYQEELNAAIATAIAQQTNTQILRLQTVGELSEAQFAAGDDYLSIMAENLVALMNGLSEGN
jgi:zinc transport system substrate-binding protein